MPSSTEVGLAKSIPKIIDYSIVSFLAFFFIGFVAFDWELLGLEQPILVLSEEVGRLWEATPWIIFSLLVADAYLKYKKIKDWKMFIKKHWPDLLMMALIPFISALKVLSLSIKLFKGIKVTKSGVKFVHKLKKMNKKDVHHEES